MKPIRVASGVRSSWLALATKSTRIASRRRAEVRSRRNSRALTPDPSGIGRAPIWTSKVRSSGIRVDRATRRGMPELSTASMPSRTSGSRSAKDRGRAWCRAGSRARAAGLASTTRVRRSTRMTGSGTWASSASATAWRCAVAAGRGAGASRSRPPSQPPRQTAASPMRISGRSRRPASAVAIAEHARRDRGTGPGWGTAQAAGHGRRARPVSGSRTRRATPGRTDRRCPPAAPDRACRPRA